MTYTEYTISLEDKMNRTGFENKLEMGISICKLLIQNYIEFNRKHNWGDKNKILDAFNFVNQHDKEIIDSNQILMHIKYVEQNTPDTNDFDDCSYALNTCSAIYHMLNSP